MKASSSSIWSNDNAADKAIDGIITPNSDTNMFHSAMDKHAWFVVDLGNYFNVNLSFIILFKNISEYKCFFSCFEGLRSIHCKQTRSSEEDK